MDETTKLPRPVEEREWDNMPMPAMKRRMPKLAVMAIVAIVLILLGVALFTAPIAMSGGFRKMAQESGYVEPSRVSESYEADRIDTIDLTLVTYMTSIHFTQSEDEDIHVDYLVSGSPAFFGYNAATETVRPVVDGSKLSVTRDPAELSLDPNLFKVLTATMENLDSRMEIRLPADWDGQIIAGHTVAVTFRSMQMTADMTLSESRDLLFEEFTTTGSLTIGEANNVRLEEVDAQELTIEDSGSIELRYVKATDLTVHASHDINGFVLDAETIKLRSDEGYISVSLPQQLDDYVMTVNSFFSKDELESPVEGDSFSDIDYDELGFFSLGIHEYRLGLKDPRVDRIEDIFMDHQSEEIEPVWIVRTESGTIPLEAYAPRGHVDIKSADDPTGEKFMGLLQRVDE